jgi:hypothetical protein
MLDELSNEALIGVTGGSRFDVMMAFMNQQFQLALASMNANASNQSQLFQMMANLITGVAPAGYAPAGYAPAGYAPNGYAPGYTPAFAPLTGYGSVLDGQPTPLPSP